MPGFWKLILPMKCVYVSVSVFFCVCVCVSVCPPPKLVITSGVIWTLFDWLNKFYSFCIAALVGIVIRPGLTIEMSHRNQPNKSKLVVCYIRHYFTFTVI